MNLQKNKIETSSDLKKIWSEGIRIVGYSEEVFHQVRVLKKYLLDDLYHHERVIQMSKRGQDIIEKLFAYFLNHLEEIPEAYRKRMEEDGKYRAVCDYISGMTDRYAELQANSIS